MFKIIKKCEKNEDNPYGVIEINSLDELNKPFLLCLSPLDDDNSTYGIIKEGARAARVRTTDEIAGGFKIDEMPFDFIGVKESENGNFNSLLDDIIYPIITEKKDINSMMKNARKINFFVYCNATKTYVELEKRLIEKLRIDGFNEDEIKKIISQISLISIATNVKLLSIYATTILFKDCNDREVFDSVSKSGIKHIENNRRESFIGYLKKDGNGVAFVYNGTGEHELKEYFKDVHIIKSALCAVVSRIVENSIENENTEELIPISSKQLVPIILRNNGEFKECSLLLNELDNDLKYSCSKYTLEEEYKLRELEEYCKSLRDSSFGRH